MDQVCWLLRQPRVRLLSLVGPAGADKSRLAAAVVTVAEREFAQGAVLVDFARLRQPSQVSRAIAEALRATQPVAPSVVAELIAWLRGKHLLLVLDNCDSLPGVEAVVVRLIDACPRLHILATTRAGLRIPGEHRFSVPTRASRRTEPPIEIPTRLLPRHVGGLMLQPAFVPKDQEYRLSPLTRRERVVATMLALGFTNTQIAEELVISYRTAETHACHVLRKLGLTSRNLVVNWALERGLVMLAPHRTAAASA